MSLDVLLLGYHNPENLNCLLPELKSVIESLELGVVEYLIVGSAVTTSGTNEVCKTLGIRCVNLAEPSYGEIYRTAIREANKDWVLILDGIGLQDYTVIPNMFEKVQLGADVVVGYHAEKGTAIVPRILNWVFCVVSGVKVTKLINNLQLYRTADLKRIRLTSEGVEIFQEGLLKLKLLKKHSFVVVEIPVFNDSQKKGHKLDYQFYKQGIWFVQLAIYAVVLRILGRKEYRPDIHDVFARETTSILLYGGVGAAMLLLNIVLFLLLSKTINYLAANFIAWFVATLASYLADKIVVFNNWNWSSLNVRREVLSFFSLRIFSGLLDMFLLWSLVEILFLGTGTAKLVDTVIVVTLNYLFSKYIVFSRRSGKEIL